MTNFKSLFHMRNDEAYKFIAVFRLWNVKAAFQLINECYPKVCVRQGKFDMKCETCSHLPLKIKVYIKAKVLNYNISMLRMRQNTVTFYVDFLFILNKVVEENSFCKQCITAIPRIILQCRKHAPVHDKSGIMMHLHSKI